MPSLQTYNEISLIQIFSLILPYAFPVIHEKYTNEGKNYACEGSVSQGKIISKSCYGGSMKSYTPGGPRNRLFVSRRAFSFFYRTRFDHCDPSYEHCHSAQHIRKQVMREVAENRRVRADSCTKTCTLRIDLFTQQTCVSRSGMERGGRESC